ncbi:hypothetical protein F5Y11DRAFT_366948 [Daldinia sp. FL1419]|nr:hypothetical protein F5Y11DRAFT_366948 [Daldinia sp. FL1419]
MLGGKIDGPEGHKYLLDLVNPKTYNLILFSSLGVKAATEGDLQRAKARFIENSPVNSRVRLAFGIKPNGQSGYADVDPTLHEELGFDEPAYILLRPDSYIAHIRSLSSLGNLSSWLNH